MPQWLAASFGTYGVPPRPDIRGHAGLCISLQGRRVQSAPSPEGESVGWNERPRVAVYRPMDSRRNVL
jgi:hypothetical protein